MTINNESTINTLLATQVEEEDKLFLMKEREPLDFNESVDGDSSDAVDLNDSSTWKLL